ncbi:NAD(P)/FAD-dependent oxidoreductase [Pseudooceanicola sp. 502str34]
MDTQTPTGPARRIAVIGAGISGMGAAHLLSRHHHVTLIEAAPRLGGHARTLMAGKRGDQPVDTGFIVFNKANYPYLVDLFEDLDVPICESSMSFGASLKGGRLEYGLKDLPAVFTQKKNMFDPRFLTMLRDVMRFNATALEMAQEDHLSIRDFLRKMRMGTWFRDYYLLPLSGAIWSTPKEKILDFPARAMIQFFENHALLHHTGQHQWYTVKGGSVEYVRRLEEALRHRGVEIRTGAPVRAVTRTVLGVEIRQENGAWEVFDEVVMATHSDDTLRLLADAGADERRLLGAIRYQPNRVVLHADASIMPKRRGAWSSWNYTEVAGKPGDEIDLTYWMNSLQPIPMDDPHFVTLNSTRPIREELIYDETTMRHPVYDLEALQAQEALRQLNGTNRTWFCGAWLRNGFHEDGLASAHAVADGIAARAAQSAVAAE